MGFYCAIIAYRQRTIRINTFKQKQTLKLELRSKGEVSMYSALSVARHIIRKCDELGRTISNLKLQKILYFVQAEFLVDTNKPCFNEAIEAWSFGPVVPEVYRAYKVYGSANIPVRAASGVDFISQEDQQIIDAMVERCAAYSASQLVEITHHQEPWIKAYKQGYNQVITQDSIQQYFAEEN